MMLTFESKILEVEIGDGDSIQNLNISRFFPELSSLYRGEILVIHVVRLKPVGDDPIDHLSIEDVKNIVKKVKPRLTILTRFGMTMIKAKP